MARWSNSRLEIWPSAQRKTEHLFAEALGTREHGLAVELHEATGGWPAAVHLAHEALRSVPPAEWPRTLADWQSKKARDLLNLLVARRGRPTPREVVMEALWPDGDPTKPGNRLSVALSTLRSVLDPERRFEHEHFVRADKDVIQLEVGDLDVDVERFLADAQAGLSLLGEGDADGARERLAAAARRRRRAPRLLRGGEHAGPRGHAAARRPGTRRRRDHGREARAQDGGPSSAPAAPAEPSRAHVAFRFGTARLGSCFV